MAMTITELQAFIDSKPDVRNIINEIADYLQANPGGGSSGIDSVLAVAEALTADRTVDLDGHELDIRQGGTNRLRIRDDNVFLSANNPTDGGNEALNELEVSDEGAVMTWSAGFNGSEKEVYIVGTVDAGTATLEYEADTHTFDALQFKIVTDDYPNGLFEVNNTDGKVKIGDESEDVNGTNIFLNDDDQAIIYTADTHTFNGAIITPDIIPLDFINDGAAATGGVAVGQWYHTSGSLKLRLS